MIRAAVGELGQPVQVLDELALVVGLEKEPSSPSSPAQPPICISSSIQREAAVDGAVAALEDVEVDPVQDRDSILCPTHEKAALHPA